MFKIRGICGASANQLRIIKIVTFRKGRILINVTGWVATNRQEEGANVPRGQ